MTLAIHHGGVTVHQLDDAYADDQQVKPALTVVEPVSEEHASDVGPTPSLDIYDFIELMGF